MCQGCVDEGFLTQATFEKLEAFLDRWPQAEFGPGHILLSDCNVLDADIQFCLDRCLGDTKEGKATIIFLRELLAIPEAER